MQLRSLPGSLTGTLILVALLAASALAAPSATTSGDWSRVVTPADLLAGSGSALQSTYTSSLYQTLVSVDGTVASTDAWRMEVQRSVGVWPTPLTLRIRRTSDGSDDPGQPGTSTVAGGTSWVTVGTTSSGLFSGGGNLADVGVQFEVSGMSLQVPPSTYSTIISFTIVDE